MSDKKNDKNKGGRPRKFKTVAEFDAKVDEYFKSGVDKTTVIVGTGVNKKQVTVKIPTITGLTLFMGFCSRSNFARYGTEVAEGMFRHSVKKAHTRVEREYEKSLMVGNTIGSIFALKNLGWSDKLKTEHDLSDGVKDIMSMIGGRGAGLDIKDD